MVLKNATKWIHSHINNLGSSESEFVFVTWGNWDLVTCLPVECQQKGIKIPKIYTRFINLKKIYKKVMKQTSGGLGSALKMLNMTFVGQPHSGIDDTANTLYLAQKLVDNEWIIADKDAFELKN